MPILTLNMWEQLCNQFVPEIVKAAADAKTVHDLTGELQLSKSGWVLLQVPNSLVKAFYKILNVPRAELPKSPVTGRLNAHVSVMRPEELQQIGGPVALKEKGHRFHWSPGRLRKVTPAGWEDMSKVWFLEVFSPELRKLRESYGLPADPKYPFHLTVAVQPRKMKKAEFSDGPQLVRMFDGWVS